MTGRLIVLSGPSGVGKSTVIRELRLARPEIWISVSATTRPPRPGEENGVHYFFLSDEEFDQWVQSGRFLEWANFAGYRYGTPAEPVRQRLLAGQSALLEIDLQGARQVRTAMPEAVMIFLAPPSFEELERRLSGRGTESELTRATRLQAAREELAAQTEFDEVLVNSSVESVLARLVALTT